MSVIVPHIMATIGLGIFALICIGMGTFAFSLVFFKYTLPQIESKDFEEANCTVLDHNAVVLDCNHQSSGERCYYYATSVDVEVQAGEETWTGIAKKRKAHAFGSEFAANEWLNSHPINSTDTCYYDPKDRNDIVYKNKGLTKETKTMTIIVSVWSGIALFCGCTIITLMLLYYGVLSTYCGLVCCKVIEFKDNDDINCNCWCLKKTFKKKEKSSGLSIKDSPLYNTY